MSAIGFRLAEGVTLIFPSPKSAGLSRLQRLRKADRQLPEVGL